MLKFMCLLALVSACSAASVGSTDTTTEKKEIIPVLKFETDKKPDGSFRFMYESGDKSFREESGVVQNAGTDDEALEVSGSYRYIDAEGREIEVHYTAGRNGFVPVGTNILSEISALAKAAADLPNQSDDETESQNSRKARSKSVQDKKVENVPVAVKVEDAKTEAPKVEEVKPEVKKDEEVKAEVKPSEENKSN